MTDPTNLADAAPAAAVVVVLDLTGLKCPLPALRTRKALRGLPPGARLIITATDPLAGLDIPNAAREMGARIEDRVCDAPAGASHAPLTVWRFVIRIPPH